MKRFYLFCVGFVAIGWFSADVMAQQPTESNAGDLQVELDTFRDGLFQAFNEERYEEMLAEYCHPDVIAMWQDGTTGQGYTEVLAEFDKLSKFIAKMQVQPTTEKRLILNEGKLVISSGKMDDRYALRRGADVALGSSWTTTLVNEDGAWKLVSFSASTNAFDNEVISLYLRLTTYWSVGVAAVLGLVVGVVVGMALKKRRLGS
jgi:uncharacterized membrane-anchored protein YhcB (DUF1043 family)